MDRAGRYRWVFTCCALLLLFAAGTVGATAPVSNDPAQLLRKAEQTQPSNQAQFNELMSQLGEASMKLSPQLKLHRRYLMARQIAFGGNYAAALPSLTSIA